MVDNNSKMFTIQEVSQILTVPKSTLRFWEKELADVFVPFRTQGGRRRYTPDHLLLIEDIKRLKNAGLSLPRIRDYLNDKTKKDKRGLSSRDIDLFADRIADLVRTAIQGFMNDMET